MISKAVLCALASAVMLPTGAMAQHGGGPPAGVGGGMGHGGGLGATMGNGLGGGMGSLGNPGAAGINDIGVTTRDQARMNSEGLSHASTTGIDHANQNSVLAGTGTTTSVTSGALAGLTTGMTLYSGGTGVGTVQQIRTNGRGSVVVAVVRGTSGGLYAVPANKLSLSGGTLSTSMRLAGINSSADIRAQSRVNSQGPMHASVMGMAQANQRSVLAGAAGTARLSGVSVGMPLLSNGAQVGTVYRVVTANGVIQRVLVQGTNGRIYSLAPSTLTAAGGSVTTTASLRGI